MTAATPTLMPWTDSLNTGDERMDETHQEFVDMINKILATAAVKDRITALGGEALALTPAEFGKRGADDSQRFGAIIKERKISAE